MYPTSLNRKRTATSLLGLASSFSSFTLHTDNKPAQLYHDFQPCSFKIQFTEDISFSSQEPPQHRILSQYYYCITECYITHGSPTHPTGRGSIGSTVCSSDCPFPSLSLAWERCISSSSSLASASFSDHALLGGPGRGVGGGGGGGIITA